MCHNNRFEKHCFRETNIKQGISTPIYKIYILTGKLIVKLPQFFSTMEPIWIPKGGFKFPKFGSSDHLWSWLFSCGMRRRAALGRTRFKI